MPAWRLLSNNEGMRVCLVVAEKQWEHGCVPGGCSAAMYAIFVVKVEEPFFLCSARVCVGDLLLCAASQHDTENEVLRILRSKEI